MFRSSTSSSESRRRWRRAGLIALVVVFAAELALRLPGVEAVIGPPDLYYQPGVQERLAALEEVQSNQGGIDVLFVGSSVVRTNISPYEFDATLAADGVELISFNGGLSGMRIDPTRLYLERLWLEVAQPRVVVQTVRYEDVIGAEPAESFEPFAGGRYEPLWLSESPLAPVQEAALDSSRLVQYAGLLTEILVTPESAFGLDGFVIDDRGFNATQRRLDDVRREFAVEQIPGGPAASRGYDGPFDDARSARGFEMLRASIAVAEQSGATYVLVNMPEHGDKFLQHEGGEEKYAAYVDALREFAVAEGVRFVDVTAGDISEYQDDARFADFNHMTPDAARAFTRVLAAAFLDEPELRDVLAAG
ncbi:MAG: hypothetical protein QNJ88_12030 [Acidimicrobiia bacterium]|nr:hypothetical protein [Acidimicrobiia bacterium]